MEWFRRKFTQLNNLNTVEDKNEILAEIQIKLRDTTTQELVDIVRNLELQGIINELTSEDRNYVEEVCKALDGLVDALEPGELHQRYPDEVRRLVQYPHPAVKHLVLKQLLRTTSQPHAQERLLRDTDLLIAVTENLSDNDLSVANAAMSILKKIGENEQGRKIIYSPYLSRTINRLLSENDITAFRVYEVVVHIAKLRDGLQVSIDSGFLDKLINCIDNDDVLLQLNALELLGDLGTTETGLTYLKDCGILQKQADQIIRSDEIPLSNLLIPGIMKFFGNLAQNFPDEIFAEYPAVVGALFEVINDGNVAILPAALDTLGIVAKNIEGKYALESLGDIMINAIKKIGEIVQEFATELRLRALSNLALILNIEESQQDNRVLSLTKLWFDSLCDDPMKLIVGIAKQPFADIRQAGLEVLAVLASQTWGQEYIANHAGLIEFLLDRNIESFKECKEVKYEVVKRVCKAHSDIFDPETLNRLKDFVKQGPFYVHTITEVATDEAS